MKNIVPRNLAQIFQIQPLPRTKKGGALKTSFLCVLTWISCPLPPPLYFPVFLNTSQDSTLCLKVV
jgi:hypothetical protein